jgi:hypothetical protein
MAMKGNTKSCDDEINTTEKCHTLPIKMTSDTTGNKTGNVHIMQH